MITSRPFPVEMGFWYVRLYLALRRAFFGFCRASFRQFFLFLVLEATIVKVRPERNPAGQAS
jgi:hypothetical protein